MLHTISIKKDKLIETLTANRKIHINEYKQAVEDYHVIAKYAMDQMAKAAQKTALAYKKRAKIIEKSDDMDDWNVTQIYINTQALHNLQLPQSHENDYDEAIEMLQFHTITDEEDKDTIALSQQDFRTFVRDDWDWKEQFSNMSTMYMSGSANIGVGTINPLAKLHGG